MDGVIWVFPENKNPVTVGSFYERALLDKPSFMYCIIK